jgi:hypothetical protein
VIAYLLDHEGFADVPATTLISAVHPAFENSENGVVSQCDLDSLRDFNKAQNLNPD